MGYKHFTVLHKYAFKKQYKNLETGEIIDVHTNRYEGAWKHAKDHFRKMSGTQATQWEGHLAEVMWRAEVKGNKYQPFFDLLRSVYTLAAPPEYRYSTPLFDSWPGPVLNRIGDWTLEPEVTDPASEGEEEEEEEAASVPVPSTSGSALQPLLISSTSNDDDTVTPSQRQTRSTVKQAQKQRPLTLKPATAALISELFSDSSLDETVTEKSSRSKVTSGIKGKNTATGSDPAARPKHATGKRKTKTDNVCHPVGYAPTKPKSKTKSKSAKPKHPYDKGNYLVWSSSDDDFQ